MRIPIRPDNDPQPKEVEPVWDDKPESYGQTGTIDEHGNFVPLPPDKIPPTPKKVIQGFIERLKNWRLNDLQQWMMGMARGALRRPDQKAQIAWVNKHIQSILDLFPKFRGRPPKPEGAQTPAERKRKQRQRERDWDWLPFPIIPHAGYLVIEASPEDPMPLFDIQRAHIVIGFELQRMMDAHHRDYSGPNRRNYSPENAGRNTEFFTDLGEVKNVVVLRCPDKVVYIIPATEKPSALDDVLAAALNRGKFLTDAPHGKGKAITGWGHKKGYDKNKSAFEPGLDDTSDFYADEFENEDDNQSPSDNPGEFADPDKRELDFGDPNKRLRLEEGRELEPDELDEAVEKYDRDNPEDESENESAAGEPKCRICKESLEGDDDDDTLLMKHLKERHPDEYRRICLLMEESWRKEQKTKRDRERRILEKQKRCRNRNEHDGMFARQLEKNGPGAYFCECGAPLCQGTHVKQVEEVLTEREAYRAKLSSQKWKDTSKMRPAPIYCNYCRRLIWTVEYDT